MKYLGFVSLLAHIHATSINSNQPLNLEYDLEEIKTIFRHGDSDQLLDLADNLVEINSEIEATAATVAEEISLNEEKLGGLDNKIKNFMGNHCNKTQIIAQISSRQKEIKKIRLELCELQSKIKIYQFFDIIEAKYKFSENKYPDLNENFKYRHNFESLGDREIFYNLEKLYLNFYLNHFKSLKPKKPKLKIDLEEWKRLKEEHLKLSNILKEKEIFYKRCTNEAIQQKNDHEKMKKENLLSFFTKCNTINHGFNLQLINLMQKQNEKSIKNRSNPDIIDHKEMILYQIFIFFASFW